MAHHLPASPQLPPSPCKGPISILSHSHTIPLSLTPTMDRPRSDIGPLPHLSSPIPHWSAQVHLDSYITCYTFARLTDRPDDGGNTTLKRWSTSTWLHGDISQKTLNFIQRIHVLNLLRVSKEGEENLFFRMRSTELLSVCGRTGLINSTEWDASLTTRGRCSSYWSRELNTRALYTFHSI
jgi:hypothetical protein